MRCDQEQLFKKYSITAACTHPKNKVRAEQIACAFKKHGFVSYCAWQPSNDTLRWRLKKPHRYFSPLKGVLLHI